MNPTTITKTAPRAACRLADAESISFELLEAQAPADPAAPQVAREWRMLAHTGKVVSRWWGRLVLDMDGAKYRPKLALLKDHDASSPIGYSTKIERTKRGIEASGKMLTNQLADEVIKYSREGFPWQASLMAVPTNTEEVEAGATAEVNGQTVQGPVTIFRKWEMHELTLTTLGADDNTTTEAFAASGDVEFTMTKKLDTAPATEPADLTAQVPAPQPVAPATNPNPPTDPAKLERERATAILRAADPAQTELAQQLVADGASLADAMTRLNADLKERLQAARQNLRVAAEPIGGGNSSAHVEAVAAGAKGVNFAQLEASPHNKEKLTAHFQQNEKLQAFFSSSAQFLAWHRNKHRCIHLGNDSNVEKLAGGLQSMGFRNVQGTYFLGYEQGGSEWAKRIAEQTTTDQEQEIYKWLGTAPTPTKWEGERKHASLTDYGITLIGDKFESTVDADIDNVRRDKTGQILKRIGEMGAKAASLDERLLSTMLESSSVAYDGLSLWNTAHKIGKSASTQSNDVTVSGLSTPDAPTSAGMSTAILTGLQQIIGMLDDRGDPMNQNARKFVLVAPLKYWQSILAALQNEFTSAGVSNTLMNAGVTISPFTNVRLSGAASAAGRRIYIAREDAGLLPFITQDENIPDAFKSQDAYSEGGFQRDKLSWGSKRITTVAPGRIELVCRVNLAA